VLIFSQEAFDEMAALRRADYETPFIFKTIREPARVKVVVASVMQPAAVFLRRDAPSRPRYRAQG
jgi:hypothetical protein